MAAKLTRLTYRIAMQLHLVAERCTIYNSNSRRPGRKLLDTPSFFFFFKPLRFERRDETWHITYCLHL